MMIVRMSQNLEGITIHWIDCNLLIWIFHYDFTYKSFNTSTKSGSISYLLKLFPSSSVIKLYWLDSDVAPNKNCILCYAAIPSPFALIWPFTGTNLLRFPLETSNMQIQSYSLTIIIGNLSIWKLLNLHNDIALELYPIAKLVS
jgi:hypothetical protein